MALNRRDLLRAGVAAGALAASPRWLDALDRPGIRGGSAGAADGRAITDPAVRELAFRAVATARAAGAAYADVRLTRTRTRTLAGGLSERDAFAIGVRALVSGYWGFASSPVWSPDEPVRLGREAVAQARTNALGKPRTVELAPIPVVRDGHWVNTTETDPFSIPLEEMLDIVRGSELFWHDPDRFRHREIATSFRREEKAFASSEGSYCTQVLLDTGASISVKLTGAPDEWLSSDILPRAARGWEYVTSAPLEDELRRLLEEAEALHRLPKKPVEVGRYDVVFDARATALLLDETLGAATELDRAMGYEANADGTSWLSDPLGMLGTLPAAAPMVSVTANRSLPGGLATVKWDDEGVEPDAFTLVKDGVLVDFQTTRESAAWLADYYAKSGAPARSHGCAGAGSALDAPLGMPPNLRLEPGRESASFEDLVQDVERGLVAQYLVADVDFQRLNGLARPDQNSFSVLEVKQGKPVARIEGAGLLFRAPELWKGVVALGGPASVRAEAHSRTKGQPPQASAFTVEAPPVRVKQVAVIDLARKG